MTKGDILFYRREKLILSTFRKYFFCAQSSKFINNGHPIFKMKNLDEVLWLDKNHVVIDCCPRTNLTSPINNPAIEKQYDRRTGFYKPERGKHTLYSNIGTLLGLTIDGDSVHVTCHECGTQYELTKDKLQELFDQVEPD